MVGLAKPRLVLGQDCSAMIRIAMARVFISHQHHDQAVAGAICAELERAGYPCWIAPRNIAAGRTWAGAITDAIKEAAAVILVFSSSTSSSPDVLREISLTSRFRRPLIPFLLDSAEPSSDFLYYFTATQWVEAKEPPLEERIQELLIALGGYVRRASDPTIGSESMSGRRRFRPSKRKTIWLAVGSAAFVIGGIWAITDYQYLTGWLNVIFFGLCLIIALANLLPKASYLRLSTNGFVMCSLFRRQFYSWDSVGEFSVRNIGRQQMIVFDSERDARSKLAGTNRLMTGRTSSIPSILYDVPSEVLARQLNEWRARAIRKA